jgi:FkbM family methyltransferase
LASVLYRSYCWLLRRYQKNAEGDRPSSFNRIFERAITGAATFLTWWHRFSFPERATGGWWWISRFRFEFLAGWLERESMVWCRELINPGMTVVDIGAHLGYYSRRFSKMVGRNGRVLAFEAHPENARILRRNLRGYQNVEVFDACVADRDGRFTLHVSPGHSNHSLLPGYTSVESTIEVDGVSLDSFLAARGIREIGFIKSDTEGAEPLVLTGMIATLKIEPRPFLLMEYNPAAIRCGGTEPEDLPERLAQLGYDVRAISADGSLTPIPNLEGPAYCNILCRPIRKIN